MGERKFIPYGRQTIDESDRQAVLKALNSDFLTTGPEVSLLETKICEVTAAKHAISCNSATAALHMASLALGLTSNDSVIVPTITFLSTANAPTFTGATVVFADVDPDSGLMTEQAFIEAIGRCQKPVKAVFPVHLNGHQADMTAISTIARKHDIKIVEDACHAFGGVQPDRNGACVPTGSCEWSDMTVFSFHPVKAVAMGEGGAITTNCSRLARKLRLLRNHGMTREPEEFRNTGRAFENSLPNGWYYEMHDLGYNYRAPDINCALGRSQLNKLSAFIDRRSQIANRYDLLLQKLPSYIKPVARSAFGSSGWHLYPVLIDFQAIGKSRNQVMSELHALKIGTQVHYLPLHLQPFYQNTRKVELYGSEKYYERVLSLPMYPSLEDSDLDYVVSCLDKVLGA